MSTVAHFEVVDAPRGAPGAIGFAKATVARLSWRYFFGMLAANYVLGTALGYRYVSPVLENGMAYPPELWVSFSVIQLSSGLCLLIALLAADEAVARHASRLRAYTLAVVFGACAAGALQWEVRALFHLRVLSSADEYLIRVTQPGLVAFDTMLYGGLVAFVYVHLRTARAAGARRRDAEIARGNASRRTLESKLQAMQARVEPQFLFNTLAQVKQLFDTDAERGGVMLDELIAYLRAALPHLRESSSTLGKEIELARAYLSIMRIRLGDRLSFDIAVPDSLKEARLPPMMLLPLVDHALVYGLQPGRDGGAIRIATEAGLDRLRLSIVDDGAGFVPERHTDDLDDIKRRLEALYGDEAALRLERLQEHGVNAGTRATLEIPYESLVGRHR